MNYVTCGSCGTNISNNEKFCPSCGAPNPYANTQQNSPNYSYQQSAPPYTYPSSPPQQAVDVPPAPNSLYAPVSVGAFIGVMLLMAVPLVNLIMLFVWAFGSSTKINLKNYARASLILTLIGIVLAILFSLVLGSVISGIFSAMGNGY
ncbi:MAG: zinc ribbon domain-containing protein [Ruminococcaceae bacterium]|nr:zinc ribbon domain-containing protein [Oscillospiraceae bacterium]